MKKILILLPALFLLSFKPMKSGLSKEERKYALRYLEKTRDDLRSMINGLRTEQLDFKPGPDRWSIKECLQHIASAEDGLWQWCAGVMKAEANPDKRAEIKLSDEQVIHSITDRSFKATAPENLQPGKSTHKSALDAFSAFKTSRGKLIKYIKTTNDDLRNHVAESPIGSMDAYQLVLFIGGHSSRHTQQIAEVIADPKFPK